MHCTYCTSHRQPTSQCLWRIKVKGKQTEWRWRHLIRFNNTAHVKIGAPVISVVILKRRTGTQVAISVRGYRSTHASRNFWALVNKQFRSLTNKNPHQLNYSRNFDHAPLLFRKTEAPLQTFSVPFLTLGPLQLGASSSFFSPCQSYLQFARKLPQQPRHPLHSYNGHLTQ